MELLDWNRLVNTCQTCNKCKLANTRTNVVLGEGNRQAKLMFVGEGPGADEDTTGRPFVGKAGQLLTKAICAIGLQREDVYIANIVKCRPPGNRTPEPDEAEVCLNYLRNQVALIKPKIIVCLGATAMKYILDPNAQISKIRGQWIERKRYWFLATYHPAALLRDESKKIAFWQDFKKIKEKLDSIEHE